ncbi:MAG: hypothetical protein OXE83_01470, partial [Gammaproteobacteria bacterium]|nr:hypothetical protein [Gammaproteobacteria bacterium]
RVVDGFMVAQRSLRHYPRDLTVADGVSLSETPSDTRFAVRRLTDMAGFSAVLNFAEAPQ